MIRHLIWDWNGTLLDDVDCCVDTLNTLLAERGLAAMDRDAYRAGFGFPVRSFYEGLGFDFAREDFARLSVDFIARYRARLGAVQLHGEAHEVLARMAERVDRQLVVSAMERNLLARMLRDYGVTEHLEGSHGIDDMNASSKVEVGLAAVGALGFPADEFLLIGDTLHDHELASAIGCACVLFARGHQNRTRLETSGRPVIEHLEELTAYLD